MFGRALLSRILLSAALVGAVAAYAGFEVPIPHKSVSVAAEPSLLFAGKTFGQVKVPLSGGRGADLAVAQFSSAPMGPLVPLQDRPMASLRDALVR